MLVSNYFSGTSKPGKIIIECVPTNDDNDADFFHCFYQKGQGYLEHHHKSRDKFLVWLAKSVFGGRVSSRHCHVVHGGTHT